MKDLIRLAIGALLSNHNINIDIKNYHHNFFTKWFLFSFTFIFENPFAVVWFFFS